MFCRKGSSGFEPVEKVGGREFVMYVGMLAVFKEIEGRRKWEE